MVQFLLKVNMIWLIASGTAVLAVFFVVKNRNLKTGMLLLIISILGGLVFEYKDSFHSVLHSFNLSYSVCEGYVLNVKEKSTDYHQLIIRVERAKIKGQIVYPNENVLFTVLGEYPKIYDLAGKKISISGEISIPPKSRNPKLFDYQLYLKTNNIYTIITSQSSSIEILRGQTKNLIHLLSHFKFTFIERLHGSMDTESLGLLIGILFGDKNYIDSDVYESFQKNGTAHILSVSGIHIAIIYGFLESIFRKQRSKFKNIFIITVLILYAALSEFSPPVNRSVFMIIVYIISKPLYRRYDLTSSTCFTAFILLLINPFVLFNTGFQLTYMAVFSIAVIQTYINNKIKIRNKLTEILGPLLGVQIGLIPITAYLFNYFSWSAFIMNIPIIILSDIILPIGFLLIILSFWGGPLFVFICLMEEFLIKSMIWINNLTIADDIGFMNVVSPSIVLIIAYYFVIFFFASELRITFKTQYSDKLILSLLVFLLIICVMIPDIEKKSDIVFLDVGQGDSIHIRTPQGRNILIDGGGSKNADYDVGKRILLPYLLKNGVNKVDLAVITHFDADHYLGIYSILKEIKFENIAAFEGNKTLHKDLIKEIHNNCSKVIFLDKGDKLNIEDGVWMKVLYPLKGYIASGENIENDSSLVIELYYLGQKILFTGDISADSEKIILSEIPNLKSEIIKVPHHGSKYSSSLEFIKKVRPKAAIVEVGKNNFGHPAPSVIERYKKEDIMVFRTDECGAILIDIEKGKASIRTMRSGKVHEL